MGPLRVTFLNPADDTDAFFATMVAFMHRAADELRIELEIIDCHRSPGVMRERARALFQQPVAPEYLLLANEQSLVVELLPLADARGIKTLLFNEGLMVPDRQVLGHPGERYKSWLGELVPDDRAAGHLLAQTLIAAARRLHRGNAAITLAGLGGTYTSSSLLRINGLRQAVAESPGVTLAEVLPANWEIDRARRETARLLQERPDVRVIWAASDLMALGAAETLEAAGKTPGVDVVVGGVDWAPFALEKVRRGTFTASVGGHFLDGAFALVLLHDHHRGIKLPAQVKSHLSLATRDNVEHCARALARRAEIDFRRFSKAETPGLESYTFSVDAVL